MQEPTEILDMATQEERIKGLETQAGTFRERVAKIEGKLETPKTTNPILIPILSTICFALVGYLGWVGIQVVNHGEKLTEIYGLLVPQRLSQAASMPENKQNIKEAQQILATAKKNGILLPDDLIRESGTKFISASAKQPLALSAAMQYLNYRSFFNDEEAPSDIGAQETNFTPSSSGSVITPPHVHVHWGFQWPGLDGYIQSPTKEAFSTEIVTANQAALMQKIGSNLNADEKSGFGLFFIIGLKEPPQIRLDGYHLRNIVIKGGNIFYDGGPVNLERVYFVNCTFQFSSHPLAQGLAEAILSSHPAVSFMAD
jgi:hypothetical protein